MTDDTPDQSEAVLASLHDIAIDETASATARVSAGKTFLEYKLGKPQPFEGGEGAQNDAAHAQQNLIQFSRIEFEDAIKSGVEQALSIAVPQKSDTRKP